MCLIGYVRLLQLAFSVEIQMFTDCFAQARARCESSNCKQDISVGPNSDLQLVTGTSFPSVCNSDGHLRDPHHTRL